MAQSTRVHRLPEVKRLIGLGKSTIYVRMAEGSFPRQISLGPRLVVWSELHIQQWMQEQIPA
jgi:prophage regulatory protein